MGKGRKGLLRGLSRSLQQRQISERLLEESSLQTCLSTALERSPRQVVKATPLVGMV